MQKNIITYESCKNDLEKGIKANLQTLALILPVIVAIFIPMICMSAALFWDDDMNRVGQIIGGVIFISIFAALPVYFIYQLLNELFELKLVGSYDFSIVKDTVVRTETVFVRRHEEFVAHFKDYGKFKLSRTQYDLTSAQDEFYLVILNRNKKILNAYHTSMNDFTENH